MSDYLGLYVEDEKDSYDSVIRHLDGTGISILPYENLPEDAGQIYQRVIDNDVDFLIIDNNLNEQLVEYNGMEVLEKVREQDPEIYVIYLTSHKFEEKHIGDFDQEVQKKDLVYDIDKVVSRLKRALSRNLSKKYEQEIRMGYKMQEEYLDKRIALLKEQLEK